MNVIVTGGCGFIGHHFVEHLTKNTDWNIIVLDKLSYSSSGFERLRDTGIIDKIKVYPVDLSIEISSGLRYELGDIHMIFHLAADTHVDHSIEDPVGVIKNNILSTVNILEYARKLKNLKLFLYFGTDEVYGTAERCFKENDRHNPGNPYSASKSGSEQICISYSNTFKIPIIRINVMNIFGERQHIEKFIPKVISKLQKGEEIEVYTDSNGNIGSRFYLHARNVASAVLYIVENGKEGECYNIVGEKEVTNLEMVEIIASEVGIEPKYKLTNEVRLGNDFRYSLDGTKLRELGFVFSKNFDESLKKTIQWTLRNKNWLHF